MNSGLRFFSSSKFTKPLTEKNLIFNIKDFITKFEFQNIVAANSLIRSLII